MECLMTLLKESEELHMNISLYGLRVVRESTHRYEFEDRNISNPDDAVDMLCEIFELDQLAEERMVMLCLNTKNKIIGAFNVSIGTISQSIVHPREIFKRAILQNSASILIAHNHPSGDPTPSADDHSVTKRLAECGKLLGIDLIDHLIITPTREYESMKARGVF